MRGGGGGSVQWSLCPGGLCRGGEGSLSGRSLSRGLCPGVYPSGGCLSMGVSVHGVSIWGSISRAVSV